MENSLKKILLKIYFSIQNFFDSLFSLFYSAKLFKNDVKHAVLVGTPKHDNLGDHIIALAETQFINEYFSSYVLTEINVERWRKYKYAIKKKIRKDDLVFLTGGGNFGNVYLQDEKLRRYVIKNRKDNLITVFPQTVYFTEDRNGQRELEISKRIYGKHNNLILCAREKISFELLKREFKHNLIYLCPDMAFKANIRYEVKNSAKKTIGICFRNDVEKVGDMNVSYETIAEKFKDFEIEPFDTRLFNTNIVKNREKYIGLLLTKLSGYSFIITNRLHGMLLGLYLGEKVFALNSQSPKIKGSIDWFDPQDVVLISNISQIDITVGSHKTDYVYEFKHYYDKLAQIVNDKL